MAKFNGYVITEAGRNLIAKGLTGDTVIFTKMQLGDGTTSNDGRTMTALVSTKADLPIIGLSNTGTGIAELRFLINNKDITTGFYIKEVGVFAKGADGVEVLYAYNVSPNPDFIPPFSANNIIEIEYVDSIIVDQVANITASIDPSITYMTQAQISSTYVKKTDIATQTEVNAGVDDSKIVTSKKLKALFGGSNVNFGVNGYEKLASVIIIQWGWSAIPPIQNGIGSSVEQTINFPITFPNSCLSVNFTGTADVGDDGIEALHGALYIDKNKVIIRSYRIVGSHNGVSGTTRWIAIGY